MKRLNVVMLLFVCLLGLIGCARWSIQSAVEEYPSFTLSFSEYPSWSVFYVASTKAGGNLIDGEKGKLGPIEKKWSVDIVLDESDYDTCITKFSTGAVDAACMTNMDTLAPSAKTRSAVVILPTSTSVGADACIATKDIKSIDDLKGQTTRGLEKSCSQYVFEEILVRNGKDPKDYPFENLDPAAAAQAMQTLQKNVKSIMVWNPFVLDTLRKREDCHVLFSSQDIPETIIDGVSVGSDVLEKPGGKRFACAVVDTYYELNKRLADPKTHDETLVAIGAKFSSLPLADMEIVVEQTKFYKTPQEALALINSEKFQKETMPHVLAFCEEHGIVPKDTSGVKRIGFNDPSAALNYTTEYILDVQEHKMIP